MDWNADAQRDLLDRRRDVRDAEAKLATLVVGSRDHGLLADVITRLAVLIAAADRNQASRAALFDAAALAVCEADEYRSTSAGPARPDYLALLAARLGSLGGRLEDGPGGTWASVEGRRIAIRFEPTAIRALDRDPMPPGASERLAEDGLDDSATRRRRLSVRYRAAYIEGSEARSRADRGHGLTDGEVEAALDRYSRDLEDA